MKLTPERQAAFCAALAASGGSVTRACEAVDISRMCAYGWRNDDPVFAEDWDKAKAIGLEALEDEATRRAYEGVAEPVFYLGQQTGTIQKYSDTLAIFLLKGGKPDKYRERVSSEITGKDGAPLIPQDPTTRAARVAQLLATARERKVGEDEFSDLA